MATTKRVEDMDDREFLCWTMKAHALGFVIATIVGTNSVLVMVNILGW